MKTLLEKIRHELTTESGLVVCDGVAPEETLQLDHKELIAEIDAVLGMERRARVEQVAGVLVGLPPGVARGVVLAALNLAVPLDECDGAWRVKVARVRGEGNPGHGGPGAR